MHHLSLGHRARGFSQGKKLTHFSNAVTAVFSRDEILPEKFRKTKAHSCPFAGVSGRCARSAASSASGS
ncbi:hypothetical protein, partial [Bradyrhizobium guangdongense]|uniref:hypothetical protein n=1 Tax=Bradyrhizobium guangdongense TaxID=1325090 RepID=UPI001AECA008